MAESNFFSYLKNKISNKNVVCGKSGEATMLGERSLGVSTNDILAEVLEPIRNHRARHTSNGSTICFDRVNPTPLSQFQRYQSKDTVLMGNPIPKTDEIEFDDVEHYFIVVYENQLLCLDLDQINFAISQGLDPYENKYTITHCSKGFMNFVRGETTNLSFLKFVLENSCYSPQSSKFVPKDDVAPITQRVVKPTSWSQKEFLRSKSCSERRKAKREAEKLSRRFTYCNWLSDVQNKRNSQKFIESQIRELRSLKRGLILPAASELDTSFVPQMNPFTVPLHFSTDEELTSIFETLSETLKNGINVNHNLDPKVVDSLHQLTNILSKGDLGVNLNFGVGIDSSKFQNLVLIMAMIATIVYHYNNRDRASLTYVLAVVGIAFLKFGFSGTHFIEIGSMLSEYVSSFGQSKPQMTVGLLEKIITAMLSAFIYHSVGKSDKGLTTEIFNHLMSFKKNKESLLNCFTSVVSVLEVIFNFISRDILGGSTYSFLQSNREDINEFLNRVNKLSDDIHHQKFAFTQANATFIHELWLECRSLIAKIPKGEDNGVILALNNACQYLASQKKVFDGMNLTLNGSRVEPVSALFLGPPGTGKSNLLYPLSYKLLLRTLPKEKIAQFKSDPNSFIYNRQPETVYWDGYNMDKVICFIDDLGQLRDVAGNPDNEWMNWIRMCSNFNYVLHMAALEKKGNVHFQSRFVFANSNLKTFNIESIVEIEAFERRVDHCFICVPKLEFCKEGTDNGNVWGRRLDGTKLPIGPLGITELTPDTSDFIEWDIKKKCETGNIYSYSQVADIIYNTANLKQNRYDQMQMYLNKIIAEEEMKPQGGSFLPESIKSKILTSKLSSEIILALLGAHNYIFGQEASLDTCIEFWNNCNPDVLTELVEGDEESIRQFKYFVTELDAADYSKYLPILQKPTKLDQLKEAFAKAYNKIKEILIKSGHWFFGFYETVKGFFMRNSQMISIVVLGLVSSGLLTMFGNYVWESTSKFFSQSYSGKPQKDRSDKRPKKVLSSKDFKTKATVGNKIPAAAQSAGSYDPTNEAIVSKVIKRNCYELWLPDQDHRLGFVTFIKGRTFVMPKHFAAQIYSILEDYPQYSDSLVTFKKSGSHIVVQCKMTDMLNIVSSTEMDSLDCLFVQAPEHFDIHSDITKYFLTREEIAKLKIFDFRLVLPMVHGFECWMGKAYPITNEVIISDESYILSKGFKYFALTKEGDCGSLMTIISHYTGGKKILGIHVAGSPEAGSGLSTCLCYEDVIREMPKDEITFDFESEQFPQSQDVVLDGRFKELYHHKLRASAASTTKITKSQLYGKWGEAKTAPAKLKPFDVDGVRIDPYQNAISKYCLPYKYIDPEIIKDIGDNVFENLDKTSKIQVDKRVLTFRESIVGLENEPDFKAISRQTSMGFPDNSLPGKKMKGKTGVFGTGDTYDIETPEAQRIIEECIEIEQDAKMGIRREHIFVDCLKDERRPIAKVKVGKTRLFSSCPFRLLVLFRRYFGSFLLWTVKNRIENGFAVGVNPYSTEWQLIANKLNKFGGPQAKNKGAGDYEGFDGSLKPAILWDIFHQIDSWYSDGNTEIRRVLWCEITSSLHIHGDHVYQWVSSNPSGQPLTTLINNLYNHYVANYVWYKVHDFDILMLSKFYDNVYYITLGDDNLFSVCLSKLEIFNEKAMEAHCPDLGMKYTSETKTSAKDMRLITDVAFLKRKFRYEVLYDRYAAPLDLDVILEIPYWITSGEDNHSRLHDNVNTSLRELALHSKEVFNEWCPKIVQAYREVCNESPDCYRRNVLLRELDNRKDWY